MNTESDFPLSEKLAMAIFRFRKFSLPENLLPGLNLSGFRMMKAIRQLLNLTPEGIKVSDLSRELQVTPGRATHMINSLEAGGFLERFSRPDDRRVVMIKTTVKGDEVTALIEKGIMEKFSELVEFLGEDESRKLTKLLDKTIVFFERIQNERKR